MNQQPHHGRSDAGRPSAAGFTEGGVLGTMVSVVSPSVVSGGVKKSRCLYVLHSLVWEEGRRNMCVK